jgi:hypothetical protein
MYENSAAFVPWVERAEMYGEEEWGKRTAQPLFAGTVFLVEQVQHPILVPEDFRWSMRGKGDEERRETLYSPGTLHVLPPWTRKMLFSSPSLDHNRNGETSHT